MKAVAKIPDALTMMTEYPDWTAALGEAFILQSQDVMAAVQRLRAKAQASGALKTTEQQVVQTQGDTIVIQPAQPQVIYVPSYDPQVVYVDNTSSSDVVAAGVIGFGLGVAAGAIIANNIDCDWHAGYCCYGCGWGYHGGYYHGGDYNGGGNTKINIDTDGGDINIGSGNNNNIGNNVSGGNRTSISNTSAGNTSVSGAGSQWKPNQDKMSQSLRDGQAQNLNKYKGTGTTGVTNNARIPNRQTGSQPISQRQAPRPSTNQGMNAPSRPNGQATSRPSTMQPRGTGPSAAKPSIPPASQRPPASARPATPSSSRPSAYGGGAGGSQRKAASRGASSRSHSGGGRGGRR